MLFAAARVRAHLGIAVPLAVISLAVWPALPGNSPLSDLRQLKESFSHPPDDSKLLMRWWWFGSAVTEPELEAEMRLMKAGGIGGFEVQPVYPLAVDDPAKGLRNLPFLSPEFLQALRFTAGKARELGLRMDLTVGSGWPYGGPQITGDLGAGRLRCERTPLSPGDREVALPRVSAHEKLLAAFLVSGDGKTLRRLDLPAGGPASVPPNHGEHGTVLFFISSHTGMMVKRPAAGAEGLVLDHYNRAALDRYLSTVGEPLLSAVAANPPYAVFCDSLEAFGSDWTADFLEEFRKRRGYDLTPHLPALAGNIGPQTGAIRSDWGLTLTELAEEEFLLPLGEWARKRGTRLRLQSYGTPPVALASSRFVDLPEGEGSFWNRFTSTRWVTSAGHLLNRNVISSETWTWLHSPAFRATPLDLKAEADRHFLQGVNQLVGHGWPYSPEAAGEPGWRLYAASALNHHNPWWMVMPDLALYLQRLSFLLRKGRPVNDVALYLPAADARASSELGAPSVNDSLQKSFDRSTVIPAILEAGYGFDFIDDATIQEHGRADKGALDVNGNRYSVIILPDVERIPVATYRKLEEFVKGRGHLIATRRAPSLSPGFLDAEIRTAEVREFSRRLFTGPGAPAHLVPDESALRERLNGLLRPDLALSSGARQVGFVHRRTGGAEIYFLANTGNTKLRTNATFRVSGMAPEIWDPVTGAAQTTRHAAGSDGRPTLTLEFEPYESRVIVFSRHVPVKAPEEGVAAPLPAPLDLSRSWKITFADSGRATEQDTLRSWTENPETRFYSGQAVYEKTVAVEPDSLRRGLAWYLDFGEGTVVPETASRQPGMRAWLEGPVREAAVVYVNGRRAGSVWCPPYRVDVSRHLRPGENTLRVVVGNLAINRMAGTPPPDYGPLIRRYGKRFDPQDMDNLKALPSGLLGPIRLLAAVAGPGVFSYTQPVGVGAGVESKIRLPQRELGH